MKKTNLFRIYEAFLKLWTFFAEIKKMFLTLKTVKKFVLHNVCISLAAFIFTSFLFWQGQEKVGGISIPPSQVDLHDPHITLIIIYLQTVTSGLVFLGCQLHVQLKN